jgi:eukaryotic-like serine/threonine-protein kinase
VDVIAVNFTDDRQPFIVMQFIQGKSLDQLLEERRYLNMDEFLNIFRQICRGLSFAHDNNVVHRDIKPSNIMIVTEDGAEKVKIVDFGIARICRTTGEICPTEALQIEQSLSNLAHSIDAESLQKLTQPGKIFGSPLYMSPEQFRGQEADCRSEVYALGCMMFEALTGVPPISGDTATETVMKKLTDAPPSLNSVVPGLTFPLELEEIISRALVPEPDERYQSVQELYEAICAL